MSRRRIAITGVGLVTALGLGREEVWSRMLDGDCGIQPLTMLDTTGYRSQVAGSVDTLALDAPFTPLERRRFSRSDRIGLTAAAEAVHDAGLSDSGIPLHRVGVLLGAGTADLKRNEEFFFAMLERGIEHARPSQAWNHFANTPVDVIAEKFGFEGLRSCVAAACASSTIAIGQAADAIRAGRLEAAVTGGTDALARLTFSGFNALRLMDGAPCRPFDRSRKGMNIGEGAGMLVLEDLERARARGAHVYGELAGYSLRCEAFHPTAPEPEGRTVAAMIHAALADAQLGIDAVDHINTHGTATAQNDRAEARGFRAALGERAGRIPVTAIKSMVGHCLGAAGAVEAAVLALTVSRGVIPPTIHHQETDPECDLDVVANDAREASVKCAVSTSLAFGGNDSALVIAGV